MKKILRRLPFWENGKKIFYGLNNTRKLFLNCFRHTGKILLYHRIANVSEDPRLLSVSPENFYNQLKFLKEKFNIISLKEMVEQIKERKLKNKSVAITIDDGYNDNLYQALPILDKLQVPATIFVVANQSYSFEWNSGIKPENRGILLKEEEIVLLAQNRLIEIGAHTINHPVLSKITLPEQEQEIKDSKNKLEKIIERPIHSFAYPFGNKNSFTKETLDIVRNNFEYACANIHARVKNSSDIFALPRYVVRNWPIEEFKEKIKDFI